MQMTPGRKLEAIVFDLDGTLVDSIPGIASALDAAFQSIGREMPTADFRRAIGPPVRIIAKRLDPALTDDQTLAIEKVYRDRFDNSTWRETYIFPGVAETLHKLHDAGIRLFIATNKPILPTRNTLDHLGIATFFTGVLTRDSRTPHYASKSEMVATLIATHSLHRGSTLMVGDTIEDREAAEANAIPCIFAEYGYGDDPVAQHSIATFAELLSIAGLETVNQQDGTLPTT